MKAILTCACGSVPKYCERAYKILFPDEKRTPVIYIKTKARPLLEDIPKGSEAYIKIDQVLTKRGRYGIYLEYNEEGKILDCWNLLKSRRML